MRSQAMIRYFTDLSVKDQKLSNLYKSFVFFYIFLENSLKKLTVVDKCVLHNLHFFSYFQFFGFPIKKVLNNFSLFDFFLIKIFQ